MELPIYLVAFGFAAMGLSALLNPASIGGYFDVSFESVDGRNEVRAVYGGFGLAIASILLVASHMPALREGVVLCVAVALGGMAGGRLLSACFERPGRWPWIFCGIESAAATALLWSLHG